tara:strand:+ start:6458 stop:6727 length:270 start_codon:yes stop_codon:yes gene_type:complete
MRKKKKLDIADLKIGDVIYAKIYLSKNLCHGAITDLHLNSKDGNSYVSLACEATGRYELVDINDIIENPTKKQLDVLNAAHRKRYRKKR